MYIMFVLPSVRAFSYVLKGATSKNFSFAPFACLKPLFARMMLSVDSLCNLQHLVCALRELRAYSQLNYLGASILHCFMTFSCK